MNDIVGVAKLPQLLALEIDFEVFSSFSFILPTDPKPHTTEI